MRHPRLFNYLHPTENQIATAYLRIAHIYRRGKIPHLALEYFMLVSVRFPALVPVTRRARFYAARCLISLHEFKSARRQLRAILRDPDTPPGMACNAALRLLRIYMDPGHSRLDDVKVILRVRLKRNLRPRHFIRWQRLATALQRTRFGQQEPAMAAARSC